MILGMVQFGIALNAQLAVADAAREGARELAIYAPRDANWQTVVAQHVTADIQGGGLSVSGSTFDPVFPYTSGDLVELVNAPQQLATVTVTYHLPDYVPMLPALIGQNPWSRTFNLTSTASFMLEQ
jgi:Flp pilus assembly protein TadG